MAKIRTIKPEFWADGKIGQLPIGCRLFFVGTWNFADDNGVIRANPKYLKSEIFKYDDIPVDQIEAWLSLLVQGYMLIPFRYMGEDFYLCRTFDRHQRIDDRYRKNIVPDEVVEQVKAAYQEHLEKTQSCHVVTTWEDTNLSLTTPSDKLLTSDDKDDNCHGEAEICHEPNNEGTDLQSPDSELSSSVTLLSHSDIEVVTPQDRIGREGIGREGNIKKTKFEIQFEEFRKSYPGSKRGLPTEFKHFKKKHDDWKEILPKLLPAIEDQKRWRTAQKQIGMFVPSWKHLQTWINQRCWEMEPPDLEPEILKNGNHNHRSNPADIVSDEAIAQAITEIMDERRPGDPY